MRLDNDARILALFHELELLSAREIITHEPNDDQRESATDNQPMQRIPATERRSGGPEDSTGRTDRLDHG
jgi:hypothetical protein